MPILSTVPNIFGDLDSRDLVRPVLEFGQPDLYIRLRQALAYYNQTADAILGLLANRTTTVQERFPFGTIGGGLLQPGAELGRALAVRPNQGAEFDVAYPIDRFRTRAIFTPEYLLRATVADVQAVTVQALIDDFNTMFRTTLAALFDNANYTFIDPKDIGAGAGTLTIRRLFNADGTTGNIYMGNGRLVNMASLNHYKVSGNAAFTNSAFLLARDTLKNVGLNGNIILFISEDDADDVSLLSDFVGAENAFAYDNYGIGRDPNITVPPGSETPRAIVTYPRAIGRIRNAGQVVTLPWMPSGYIFAMDATSDRPLVVRESDLAQLRGFRLTGNDVVGDPPLDGPDPILNKYWERVFGVGVRNRGNGVVVQITASGTYTAPTFF
jgi:hypothetical protein